MKKLASRVAEFEKHTGCELVFHFRRKLGPKPVERNRELFEKFKLHETKHRNAILVTLALAERQFAVWADSGIESHAGEALRVRICETLGHKLKENKRLEALESVISEAEATLKNFPKSAHESPDHRSEISDAPIIEDEE